MDYQTWRQYRDHILSAQQPLRLDCMNPFYALDHLYPKALATTCQTLLPEDVIDRWQALSFSKINAAHALPTCGIRHMLHAYCQWQQEQSTPISDSRIWLPRDVFPTYHQITQSHNIAIASYDTLPDLNLSPTQTAGLHDTLLIPAPLSPLGRYLLQTEVDQLIRWLSDSASRTLILDTVYHYEPTNDTPLTQLMLHSQCLTACSISKTWVQRQVFGATFMSSKWLARLSAFAKPPSQAQLQQAQHAFDAEPLLPSNLNDRFRQQWLKLKPHIQSIVPTWEPPETGYFSTLPIAQATLLNTHNTLAVPASVFGSKASNLCIISCLHDIKDDDQHSH